VFNSHREKGRSERRRSFYEEILAGFRKETDKNARDDLARIKTDQLNKLRRLLELGGHEAEPEFVQLLKDWKPDIGKEELAEESGNSTPP
jgi:hypothetical protein